MPASKPARRKPPCSLPLFPPKVELGQNGEEVSAGRRWVCFLPPSHRRAATSSRSDACAGKGPIADSEMNFLHPPLTMRLGSRPLLSVVCDWSGAGMLFLKLGNFSKESSPCCFTSPPPPSKGPRESCSPPGLTYAVSHAETHLEEGLCLTSGRIVPWESRQATALDH